ncbi:MAG: hypothetical protein K2I51_02130 [Muribaculaceae bacterium]|nr:hypothetical protein [Muribaculaceae bacterium]
MKKFLLAAGCVAMMASAVSAKDYVISASGLDMTKFTQSSYTDGGKEKWQLSGTWTSDDQTVFNVVMKQAASTTTDCSPILGESKHVRWYKNVELTITAPANVGAMKQMVFTTTAADKTLAFTPQDNKGTVTADATNTTITWQYADGMNPFVAVAANGQIRFSQLVISDEVGSTPVVPTPTPGENVKVANIAAWLADAKTDVLYEFENPVKVVYQNGLNLYVQDETGSMFIYGSTDQTYTPGQTIPAGFTGNYVNYYSTIELSLPKDGSSKASYKAGVDGEPVQPAEVAIADIDGATMGNKYIVIRNCDLANIVEKNFEIVAGNDKIAGYNKFGIDLPETTELKDVIGVVNYYQAKGADAPSASIYPIEIKAAAGIAGVEADLNAPVEYFNLQGVRVENPANGLYIMRQGSKVAKVIL